MFLIISNKEVYENRFMSNLVNKNLQMRKESTKSFLIIKPTAEIKHCEKIFKVCIRPSGAHRSLSLNKAAVQKK